uniref:Putative ovule protein n=1 Tax=Solanum chacoense TaxID=4108 RepID=A0A0V0HYR9_SOLCH
MHFKGLLRSKSTHKSNSVSGLLNKFVDSPPIVIMKPLYSQGEMFPACNHEQNPSGSRNKWEESSSDDQKGASNFTIYRKMQTGKDHNNRYSKEKGRKDHGEAPSKSKTLQVLIQPKTKIIASSPGKYRGEATAKSKTFDVLSQEKQPNTKIRASSLGKDLGEAPSNSKMLRSSYCKKNYPNAKIKASSPGKYSGEATANSKTVKVFIQEKQPNARTRASSPGKTGKPKKEAIGKERTGLDE